MFPFHSRHRFSSILLLLCFVTATLLFHDVSGIIDPNCIKLKEGKDFVAAFGAFDHESYILFTTNGAVFRDIPKNNFVKNPSDGSWTLKLNMKSGDIKSVVSSELGPYFNTVATGKIRFVMSDASVGPVLGELDKTFKDGSFKSAVLKMYRLKARFPVSPKVTSLVAQDKGFIKRGQYQNAIASNLQVDKRMMAFSVENIGRKDTSCGPFCGPFRDCYQHKCQMCLYGHVSIVDGDKLDVTDDNIEQRTHYCYKWCLFAPTGISFYHDANNKMLIYFWQNKHVEFVQMNGDRYQGSLGKMVKIDTEKFFQCEEIKQVPTIPPTQSQPRENASNTGGQSSSSNQKPQGSTNTNAHTDDKSSSTTEKEKNDESFNLIIIGVVVTIFVGAFIFYNYQNQKGLNRKKGKKSKYQKNKKKRSPTSMASSMWSRARSKLSYMMPSTFASTSPQTITSRLDKHRKGQASVVAKAKGVTKYGVVQSKTKATTPSKEGKDKTMKSRMSIAKAKSITKHGAVQSKTETITPTKVGKDTAKKSRMSMIKHSKADLNKKK